MASAGLYAKSVPHPRQPRQHPTTQFFTGRMPFLPPNQQHQSPEGKSTEGKSTCIFIEYMLVLFILSENKFNGQSANALFMSMTLLSAVGRNIFLLLRVIYSDA